MSEQAADFRVQLDGPHAVFYPQSEAAREWWDENVEDGPSWCGGHFVQGPYSALLFDGIEAAGFVIETA